MSFIFQNWFNLSPVNQISIKKPAQRAGEALRHTREKRIVNGKCFSLRAQAMMTFSSTMLARYALTDTSASRQAPVCKLKCCL